MNYKRKSRQRFFLLVRSRTPPISSEFRGGLNTPPPRYDTVSKYTSSKHYNMSACTGSGKGVTWRFSYNSKSKVVPWQVEVAQGVPGRLRPQIFLTFRHYKGGRSSAKHPGLLYPSRNPWYSLSEAESTSGHMVLSGVPRKKSPVTPPGINPGTVQPVAQRLNHYATPGPFLQHMTLEFQNDHVVVHTSNRKTHGPTCSSVQNFHDTFMILY